MSAMTLEQLLKHEDDGTLLDIYKEITDLVVPATGFAHEYCRKVNRMIDAGKLCINPTTYRKIYLPGLAKAVRKELADRYVMYCYNAKGPVEEIVKEIV